MSESIVSPAQLRAARALLNISAAEVAASTRLGLATIRRSEKDGSQRELSRKTERALREFYAAAGVLFLPAEPGLREGVRLAG